MNMYYFHIQENSKLHSFCEEKTNTTLGILTVNNQKNLTDFHFQYLCVCAFSSV